MLVDTIVPIYMHRTFFPRDRTLRRIDNDNSLLDLHIM